MTPFLRTNIIKGNADNERSPSSCLFLAFITLFPDIAFINEEATCYIKEEVISAINKAATDIIIAARNSCFFLNFMFCCFSIGIN